MWVLITTLIRRARYEDYTKNKNSYRGTWDTVDAQMLIPFIFNLLLGPEEKIFQPNIS
jgi:hypothetical protein